MRVEEGLVSALSGIAGGRVYAERLPADVSYPCVTYSRVSTSQNPLLDGVDTLTEVRIQLDIWGESVSSVKGEADSLRTLLNGHRGDLGGVGVQYVQFLSEMDASQFEGDWEVRRVSMDFLFTLHE